MPGVKPRGFKNLRIWFNQKFCLNRYFIVSFLFVFQLLLDLIHTRRQNCELVSLYKVLRLFIDKLRTNRSFCNYPLTEIAGLWSPTADGKLQTFSANFCSVKLVWEETLKNLWKMFVRLHQSFRKFYKFCKNNVAWF